MLKSAHSEPAESPSNEESAGLLTEKTKYFLSYAAVIAFIGLCAFYIYHNRHDFAFVFSISYRGLFLAGLFILACYFATVYQLNLFLKSFGLKLGAGEVTAITMGMQLGNLVLPMRGGSGALAVYLKKVRSLNYQSFATIYAGTALLIALINTGLAVIALIFLKLYFNFQHMPLWLLTSALFGGCIYLSVFPPPVKFRRPGILGKVFVAADSWHNLTRDRLLLFKLAASMLVLALCSMAAFYLIYDAVGCRLSFSAVMISSSLGNIANLFPFTPGSLGIFDAVIIEVPQLFGLDPARALGANIVFRILIFFWAVLIGLPGLIYLLVRGKDAK